MSHLRTSSAEQADNHRRLLFLAMLFMSMVFGIKAGFYWVDAGIKSYLEVAGQILAVSTVIVLGITVYLKLRFIPRNERKYLLTTTDSFANQMMNQACKTSWILTFIMLIVITGIKAKDGSTLPARFYLDLTVAFMLAVYSISFFIQFQTWGRRDNQELA